LLWEQEVAGFESSRPDHLKYSVDPLQHVLPGAIALRNLSTDRLGDDGLTATILPLKFVFPKTMKQIKGKPLKNLGPDVSGEITIDDIALFHPTGRMAKVWLMWETVRRFAKLLDDAHAKEILSLEDILKKYEGSDILPEDKIYDLLELTDLHSQTNLSSKVLVKATVLELLSGFAEFAVKEIVKLAEPDQPTLRRGWQELINILQAKGIFTGYPENYEKHIQDRRETVRNNFAHGNWEQLAEEVGSVDLDEAVLGTVEFIGSMQHQLEEKGYDMRTPTITPVELPEGF
jgi:hypothetical protein